MKPPSFPAFSAPGSRFDSRSPSYALTEWSWLQREEVVVRDAALKQPANPTPEEVQADLQERTRAIIAARPDLEHELRRLTACGLGIV
jgi:hypothetical protein